MLVMVFCLTMNRLEEEKHLIRERSLEVYVELKKVYKNEKDANDYMAAIMIAKGGG